MSRPVSRLLALCILGLFWIASAQAQSVPITINVPENGYVSVVIEDLSGNRIRNLIQETYFTAGTHTIYWDGYDEGVPVNRPIPEGAYDIQRTLVTPGTYRARALFHEGIDLTYEQSVQSPGTTPWHTLGQSGGWFSDHQTPWDVAFLPASFVNNTTEASLLFVAATGEAGDGVMLLKQDGTKVDSKQSMPGGFQAGYQVARDMGPNRDTGLSSYVALLDSLNLRIHELDKGLNANNDPFTYPVLADDDNNLKGMAVYDNVAVVSLGALNKVIFVNLATKTVLREITKTDPRGVAVTDDQKVYLIKGKEVERYNANFAAGTLGTRTLIVSTGLENPQGIFINKEETEIYVSDWGTSHQVKVFDINTGVLKRTIGKAGGPQIGLYDEERMAYPRGIAVDDNGKLWVAEKHYTPKRISRWNALTGVFDQAWYGPPKYGGGGMLDPTDKTRFYYAQGGKDETMRAIEFELDWTTGTNKVKRILVDMEHFPTGTIMHERAPEWPRYAGGRQYLVSNNHEWGSGRSINTIWLFENDRLYPVAVGGVVAEWDDIEALGGYAAYHDDSRKVFYIWTDNDRDGLVEASEVKYREQQVGTREYFMGTTFVEKDLSFTSIHGFKVPAPTIGANGVPIYDFSSDVDDWVVVASDETGEDLNSYHLSDGSYFVSFLGPLTFYKDGAEVATYHSQCPNRNFGSLEIDCPVEEYSGQIVESMNPLGDFITPVTGDAGPVFGINSDYGQSYLLTADGYFVTKFLEDYRTHPLWRYEPGVIQRGSLIDGVSSDLETFWPTLNQTADGNIYLITGKEHSSILKVNGLETAQRLDFGTFPVTSDMLDDAGNLVPTVTMTGPANGSEYPEPASITFQATASDFDGTVTRVEFYDVGVKIGDGVLGTDGKWSFTWQNVLKGDYDILAKAYDDKGGFASSSNTITVTVSLPPTANLTSPDEGTVYTDPATFTIKASATDPDGTVSKVEFFNGSTLLGTDTASPWEYAWSGVPAGIYSLTSKTTDNDGFSTTSAPVTVIVNAKPVVSMSSPANGSVFLEGSNIPLKASATDSDGTITKVEFWRGNTFICEVQQLSLTVGPNFLTSECTWTNAPSGTYTSVKAKATDNQGAVTESATISITVNKPPTANITSPASGTVYTAPATFTIKASATDGDGTVSKVEFFNGSTLLGTDTASPWEYAWSGVAAGTYTLTSKTTDNNGASTTSTAITVTVNAAASVSITSPASGSVFLEGSNITLKASATDSDGTITKVEFWRGATFICEDTASPWECTWTNAPSGTYTSVKAKATDNQGAVTESATISITVNKPPTANITSPASGTVYTAPATFTIKASATDGDGTVSKVEFFNGSTLLGTDTASPWEYAWSGVAAGTYTLTSKTTDNNGASTTSTAITVTVNNAPTVSITSPANGTVVNSGTNVTISATASDPGGSVTKVEFWRGGILLGTDTSSPYSYLWTNVDRGTYTLTAKAYDNQNAITTSAGVTLTVNALPEVNLTNPTHSSAYKSGTNLTLRADVTDDDGANTIAKVEFFNGTTKLGEDTTAPYEFHWQSLPMGTFRLQATATDTDGATASSSEVPVTFTAEAQQFIALQPGWNLVSGNLDPRTLAATRHTGEPLVYLAQEQQPLGQWEPLQARMIHVARPDTLVITGEYIAPATTPVSLQKGWNLVPYLRETPMPLEQALASLSKRMVAVKDDQGGYYLPALGLNTLGTLVPGRGYKVYVSDAQTLKYPPNGESMELSAARKQDLATPRTAYTGADAVLVVEAPAAMEGYTVTATSAKAGVLATGLVQQGRAVLHVVGDDPMTPTPEGAVEGEPLTLGVTTPLGQELRIGYQTTDLLSGATSEADLQFRNDAFLALAVEELPATYLLAQNYPNPFNPTTTLRYELPENTFVTLEVFNALGQRVATLVRGDQKAGRYELTWDAAHLASGLYLYRLTAKDFSAVRKMMLVK